MNKEFTEKIVSFYPYNTQSADGTAGTHNSSKDSPVFYFTYQNLPSIFNISFEVALGALNLTKKYKLKLEIKKDTDEIMLSSYVDIDPSSLPRENLIYNDFISRTFALTSAYFTITSGEHSYIATLSLIDDNNNINDTSTTWFVTNQ